jgi:hypothetical protein
MRNLKVAHSIMQAGTKCNPLVAIAGATRFPHRAGDDATASADGFLRGHNPLANFFIEVSFERVLDRQIR